VRLALVADTHMPKGNRRIPDECLAAMRDADLIVHAGDLVAMDVLDLLRSLGPPVRAVHGNIDRPDVRSELPETDLFEADGATIGLIHDAGPVRDRLRRMRRRFSDADAVVFGHSHLPLLEADAGFQIFNPGSPTERRRAPVRSFGLAEVDAGEVRFRHIWLP
jgi:putative phosphoesterase